jgi:hypothetical protein
VEATEKLFLQRSATAAASGAWQRTAAGTVVWASGRMAAALARRAQTKGAPEMQPGRAL